MAEHQLQPFTRQPDPDGDDEAADAWADPETLGMLETAARGSGMPPESLALHVHHAV